MIEIKIPNDPTLLRAVAAYFTRLAGGNVRQVHGETIAEVPRVTEAEIAAAVQNPVISRGYVVQEGPAPVVVPSPWQAADTHPGDAITPGDASTPAAAFATPAVVTGGSVNVGAPSPGPESEAQATHNVHPEVDGRGFRWDARIHSSSKAILAKAPHGWKPLRGVNSALVEQVEAEQRAQGFGIPRATATPPAVNPVIPPPNLAATFPPSDSFGTPTPVAQPLTFAQVMARIGAANKLTEAQGVLAQFGLPSFPVLGTKPELWEPFLTSVGA